jgi:hypothetical protein
MDNTYGVPKWAMMILFVAMVIFYLAGGWNSYRNSIFIAKQLNDADKNPKLS